MTVTIRPATPDDADAISVGAHAAFADLARRHGQASLPPLDEEMRRFRADQAKHLMQLAPKLCHVAVTDGTDDRPRGQVVGAGLGAVRDGLYYLSLMFVVPDAQVSGLGSKLMGAAVPPLIPGIIAASPDAPAIRLYAKAGFRPEPVFSATGPLRHPPPRPEGVVDGSPDDVILTQADAHGRGALRTDDLGRLLAGSTRLRVVPGRGYAISEPQGIRTIAALDSDAARLLLQDAMSVHAPGTPFQVWLIRGAQHWAIDAIIASGMSLASDGALCFRQTSLATSYLPDRRHM